MNPRSITVAFAAVVCIGAGAPPATSQPTAPGRIPTVSRLVMLFTEQEIKLDERIRAGDAAGVGNFLSDDFELRANSQPGRPIPRAEWVRQSLQSPGPAGTPTQMAVHDLGTAAVVSFLLETGGNQQGNLFVVDVWRRSTNDWKLAIRYAAPAGPSSVPIPGVPPEASEIPKKY